jgi:DUF4097 and DUF4098 domain-containing protein YvlB
VSTSSRKGLPRPFVIACIALGGLVALWGALFFAAWSVRQTGSTSQVYADVETLRIDGGNGDIDVIAEDRDDVEVVTHLTWGLKKPQIEQGFSGGALRLSGGCGFWGSFGPEGCEAEFEVRVPRDLDVEVRGSSGDVSGHGLTGPVSLHTSSGDVEAIDLSGRLRIGSSSGDLDVENYRGREVEADASSGDVTVRALVVPRRIEAVTSSGDVTVVVPGEVAYDVETDTSSGDTSVEVDQSRGSRQFIRAKTSSGDVTVARTDGE